MRMSIVCMLLLSLPAYGQDYSREIDKQRQTNRMLEEYSRSLQQLQPRSSSLDRGPDILSRHSLSVQPADPLPQILRTNEEILNSIRLLNSQISVTQSKIKDIESRHHDLEVRLTALERGAVVPFRAPATLTDPIAAAAAGRVVGQYDQFGRFIPPASLPVQTQVMPVQAIPVQSTAFASYSMGFAAPAASFAPSYAVSSGGCSGGSCGRPGLVGRLFGRRR